MSAEQRLRHHAAAFAIRGGGGSLALEIFYDSAPLSSALLAAGLSTTFAGTFMGLPSLPKLFRLEGAGWADAGSTWNQGVAKCPPAGSR